VAEAQPAAPVVRMKKRRDFLAAARARRSGGTAMTLQARRREPGEPGGAGGVRVGFTCSKKLGNAVARNRAKRRLREAARLTLPGLAREGWDYVVIGRPGTTAGVPFPALCAELATALARVHGPKV
jgi:ribonuclease P protein component